MKETLEFLTANPMQYFATVDAEGRPRVRPFQFMLEKEGRLYFCTSNQKKVYAQLQHNLWMELCACSPQMQWLRLSGKAVFSNDLVIKAAVLEKNPFVKSIYQTPDNPAFEVFYIDGAKAVFADFSGQPPREKAL